METEDKFTVIDPNQVTIPEVLPPETVDFEDRRLVREAALEVIAATAAALDKYFLLCTVIHDRKVMPKVARAELLSAGFDKTRVAEILRVALSTDELFEQYRTKAIGFKLALEKARNEAPAERVQKRESERLKFERRFTELLEELIPVAGEWPGWLMAGSSSRAGYDLEGQFSAKAHGRTYWVMLSRMSVVVKIKKSKKAHAA